MAASSATDFAAQAGPIVRPEAPGPWMSGRAIDLLFGYGLAYLLSFPFVLYWGQQQGLREWPAALVSLFSLAVAAPHYGATLLRAYEQRADRQRYAVFTVYASVLLTLAFGVGLYDAVFGSWLLTLYVTWSPWHFAGQNYGLSVMSLRRRGIAFGPEIKRLLYASFILSAMLSILALHAANATVSFAQGYDDSSGTFSVLRLGIPLSVVKVLGPLLAIAYLGTLFTAARRLLRARPEGPVATASQLVPALLLVVTQALWFTLPAVGLVTGNFSLTSLPFAAIWLSVAHSIQYLWVSSYYARHGEGKTTLVPFLGKSMLAGCAISVLPATLFVPGLFGYVAPFTAGATVLLFAVVNLHHFLLDGAIWKLRDGRVARVLLRPVGDEQCAGASEQRLFPARTAAFRGLLWSLGAVSLAIPLFAWHEVYAGGQLDGSLERSQTSVRRLAWLGRDNPHVFAILGWHYEKAGMPLEAIEAYRRSAGLDETPLSVSDRLGWLLVVHESANPRSKRDAVEHAEAASAARGHMSAAALQTLSAAYANAGRSADARRVAVRALAIAQAEQDANLVGGLERHLALLAGRGTP